MNNDDSVDPANDGAPLPSSMWVPERPHDFDYLDPDVYVPGVTLTVRMPGQASKTITFPMQGTPPTANKRR